MKISIPIIFIAGGLADRSPVPAVYRRQQSDYILLSNTQRRIVQKTSLSPVSKDF